MTQIEITTDLARTVLEVVDAGLTTGKGTPIPGSMCVEAAVCYALGLPHSDNPPCVGSAVRAFKIRLNDSLRWPSDKARAKGLRKLAVAQLGSDQINQVEFARRLAIETIRQVLAKLMEERGHADLAAECRAVENGSQAETVVKQCRNATAAASDAYAAAAYAAYAAASDATAYDASDAADAAYAAYDATAYDASDAAAYAAYAADAAASDAAASDAASDATAAAAAAAAYLTLSANIATQILIDMSSPGAAFLALADEGEGV